MTQPNPETVTNVPVTEAEKNVATSVDTHTPTPAPDPAPEVHESADKGLGELREMVESLSRTVNTLVETVTKSAGQADDAPRSVPWTHRGSGHHTEPGA